MQLLFLLHKYFIVFMDSGSYEKEIVGGGFRRHKVSAGGEKQGESVISTQ
jgi:hypothetical protein